MVISDTRPRYGFFKSGNVEFDVVTFAQEIMSVQGQLTLSTYDVRLTFESGVISTSYQYVH